MSPLQYQNEYEEVLGRDDCRSRKYRYILPIYQYIPQYIPRYIPAAAAVYTTVAAAVSNGLRPVEPRASNGMSKKIVKTKSAN